MFIRTVLVAGVLLLLYTRATRSDSYNPEVIQIKDADFGEENSVTKTRSTNHEISIVGDEFIVDGQPLHIMSGSLHYFRLPAAYWRDRLSKLKAAGLNAVSTYVDWSYHEPEERQYNFEGDRDLVTFIKTAAEEGLHVLLRPGPYICAERDLGGLPYWLLGKYPNIQLRSTDKDFLYETRIWMAEVFKLVKPLLFGNGGPIILVQVENEYGSYGNDSQYKIDIRDIMMEHIDNKALLYTTDGWWNKMFRAGAVAGALTTVDFGSATNDDIRKVIESLRRFMPSGPLMNSEFYPGWLTHWREQFATVPTDSVVRTLKAMLDNKFNVNFYMFFGGTNFEYTAGSSVWAVGHISKTNITLNKQNLEPIWKAGANFDGTYQPDLTSYDYDAPLSEAGDPTPKYYAIREALKSYNFVNNETPAPQPSPKGNYGKVTVAPQLDLLSIQGRASLGKKYNDVVGSSLPTFESLRQRGGFVLYETVLTTGVTRGLLQIQKPRDLISVYLDGEMMGQINRMIKLYSLPLAVSKNGTVLSLLVENQGRINYGPQLHDYKGILSEVIFDNKVLEGPWKITGYPLEDVNVITLNDAHVSCPALYKGQFTLPEGQAPLDTFLDPTGWEKGLIWVNGHNLGRYWPTLGPQITLYVPGVWLKPHPEVNDLQILELVRPAEDFIMEFRDYPILNRTNFNYRWIV